jgi:NAD(P)H dehydrogenase (quinone)
MHGGQETTLLSMMLPLFHHGMLLMGLPFTEPELSTTRVGGSPYGATHVAAAAPDGRLAPEEGHLAQVLGRRVAQAALALRRDRR